ncbi:MAG: PorV/PorQ family protein [Endomicrobia bacterium]|nr:PorV/PorQ family protein [Endomicrobiia bacterium]
MNKNKLTAAALSLMILSVCAALAYADAGVTGGQIFAYNPDPVSGAMGDAGIALLADKPACAVINPAKTIATYRTVGSLSNSSLFGEIQYNFAGAQFPTTIGNFGISFMYAGYGDIDYYSRTGAPLKMNSTSDMAAVLNYSVDIRKTVPMDIVYGGLGMNIKVMRSQLGDYSSEAFALDLGGVLTLPQIENFAFALAYRNFGSDIKFVEAKNPLPEAFVMGVAYKEKDFYNLQVALDYSAQLHSGNYFSAGLSITPVYFLTFRGGVKLGDQNLNADVRMGVGFEYQAFSIDYAYTPANNLNGTHNFNLSYAFGKFANQKAAYDYYMQNHFRDAVELYYKKDYVAARQKFDEILSVYPEHKPSQKYLQKITDELADIDVYNARKVNAYMKKADSAIADGDVVSATNYFNKVLELDPENSLARTGIERVDEYTKLAMQARDREKNRERIEYLWARSENFYKQGELVRSKEALGFILEIDPENQAAKDGIINIDNQLSKIAADKVAEMYSQAMDLFNQGKYQEAIRYFEAIIIAAPHRNDVQDLIAKAQQNIQQIKENERTAKVLAAQDKVRGELMRTFDTALNYYSKNRLEEAVKYFRRSKEIADKYEFTDYSKNAGNYITKIGFALSEAYYKRGFELFRKNDFESAAKNYKIALGYNPDNTSAAFELERIGGDLSQKFYEQGMSYYSRGDFDKAREYLKRALYFKPDKIEAKRALEKLQ